MREKHLYFYFIFGDSQVLAFRELQIELEVSDVLDNFVFQI